MNLEKAIKISPFLLGNLAELNESAVSFSGSLASHFSPSTSISYSSCRTPPVTNAVSWAVPRHSLDLHEHPERRGTGWGSRAGVPDSSPLLRSPKIQTPPRTHVQPWPRPLPTGTPPARQGAWRGAARPPPLSMVGSPGPARPRRPSPRAALSLPRRVSMVRGGAVTWRGPGGSGGSGG